MFFMLTLSDSSSETWAGFNWRGKAGAEKFQEKRRKRKKKIYFLPFEVRKLLEKTY